MRVLLCTGTGGAGCTTVAAATAVRASRLGTKTLLVSTRPRSATSRVLAVPVSGEPAEVEPGLSVQGVDARSRLDELLTRRPPHALLDALGVDAVAAEELVLLPGVADLLALLELRDRVGDGPWDLVVVDCGPVEHVVRMLALPHELSWYGQTVLPPERRVQRALRADPDGDAVVDVLARLRAELADVDAVLRAPSTTVRLVLLPDAGGLAAGGEALAALTMHGYHVDAVIANRVVPEGGDPWRSAVAADQAASLALAEDVLAPLPVTRLPYLPSAPVGPDALARLGEILVPAGVDPLAVPRRRDPVAVERSGQGYVLRMDLPLVGKEDVGLARRGDDLLVSVGDHRRHVPLPSGLRRCVVVGASLRDGSLRVRFEPDPEQWPTA